MYEYLYAWFALSVQSAFRTLDSSGAFVDELCKHDVSFVHEMRCVQELYTCKSHCSLIIAGSNLLVGARLFIGWLALQ